MTTPERLRRRQRVETALVVIVIIMTCLSTAYTLRQNERTQNCLQSTVKALSDAIQTRSQLTANAQDNIVEVLGGSTQLIIAPPPTSKAEEAARQKEFRDLFVTFQKKQNAIAKQREETPIPDYPTGKCDGS